MADSNKSNKISADVALGIVSDNESEDYSENESSKRSSKSQHNRDTFDSSDDNDEEDDEEEQNRSVNKSASKRSHFDAFDGSDDEDDKEEDEYQGSESGKSKIDLKTTDAFEREAFNDLTKESKLLKKSKFRKLSPEQLAKHQKKILKTGVIYISKIPPYMKPLKMRQVLSRFGEIDRLFLKPEDIKTYRKRVKYGGNKKRSYIEGWAEFVNKKDAKLCEATLNGNILGGKKGSFYYDDVMNIKYIKSFKWTDLTEQIARENEVRQAKLQAELSQATKLNKAFIANVEKSKMIANIQLKKKERNPQIDDEEKKPQKVEMRRTFVQRDVNSKRADAPEHMKTKQKNTDKLNSVLSSIF